MRMVFTIMVVILALLALTTTARAIDSVTDKTFLKEVSSGKGVTIVDFYTDWCGYCQEIHPVLLKLEGKYKGKVRFVQVNAQYNQSTAGYFGVNSYPSVYLSNDGTDYVKIENGKLFSEVTLSKEIDAYLKKHSTSEKR